MPCLRTSRTKSSGPYRARADLAKCGFADRKFSGRVCRFVKLHLPPPDIRIFLPICQLCSTTTTRRPRLPASMAHIKPAAPAPITSTSTQVPGIAAIVAERLAQPGGMLSGKLAHEPENPHSDGGRRGQLRGSLRLPAVS